MAQTDRNVNEIVAAAFFLIGEFDEYEPLAGPDLDRGVDLLNLIIDHYSGNEAYISYTDSIEFTLNQGQQDYIVTNVPAIIESVNSNRIATIEYCTIKFENVSYPVKAVNRTEIYTNFFNDSLEQRPQYVLLEKHPQYSLLKFFAIPNQEYQCLLQAKFYIDKFEKFQSIKNVPLSMQRFLIYALARELRSYYPTGNWAETAEEEYQKLYYDFVAENDRDMMVQSSGLLRRRGYYYYGSPAAILGG